MSRNLDWRSYVNESGDFALPEYLYRVNNDLMKQTLDMGTLLSEDKNKLRAYKEQVKKIFKKRWFDVAQALESFDIIVSCGCNPTDFCEVCGGSRYLLNESLTPSELREISLVSVDADPELAEQLTDGLKRALEELNVLPALQ